MRRVLRVVAFMSAAAIWPLALGAQDASTVYVVSYIEAVPATQGQVAALLKQLADASRKDGAIRAEALQRTTESDQFLMLEIWKDQSALDGHAAAAQTKRLGEQLAPLLLAPIDQRVCVATMVAPLREGRGAVYVVTHIDVPGTSRDAALRLMQPFIGESRKESGNLRFDIVHQKDRTNHFTAIEVWTDQKSVDGHQQASQTRAFRGGITPLLGALYDRRSYKPL